MGAVIERAGDAGGVDDVVEATLPLQRLDDVVLDEFGMGILGDHRAFLARRDQVVRRDQLDRLLQHVLVEVGEDLHEIAAEKASAAGQEHGLAGEVVGGVAQALADLFDIGLQQKLGHHTTSTLGMGMMNFPPALVKAAFFSMIGRAKFHARITR
nr:hypothetical protein [Magnetospirillum sp. 15-1]